MTYGILLIIVTFVYNMITATDNRLAHLTFAQADRQTDRQTDT